MNHIKNSTNVRLFLYRKEDADSLKKQIPPLTTIKGTASFHEVIVKSNGQVFSKNRSDEDEVLIKTNF
jgi:hypothetical protein